MDQETYNAVRALEQFYGYSKNAALVLIEEYRQQSKIKDLLEFIAVKQRLSNGGLNCG